MAEQTYKFYIGVDVSKHTLDVVMSNHQELQVSNNEAGVEELIKKLPSKKRRGLYWKLVVVSIICLWPIIYC